MESLKRYFPELNQTQIDQFTALDALYRDWNAKINVISRKDIDNLYQHHVLHSLAIAKVLSFQPGTKVVDVGTGGGFPGIPLAILFPETYFHLVDSIGKKVRVAHEIADAIGLKNCSFQHARMEDVKGKYDFVVSRAVMPLSDLVKLVKKNIAKEQKNALPNGLICLKGGELEAEVFPYRKVATLYAVSDFFTEEYFTTKKAVYLPL
ncbi:MAG TPA: 16S rRNA (guanine(527)-N(7))-methyltransferase RsmG [Paludibacteraceae bacterium]|nr:16S rRNA (guanine(527)-N(7))-methyltransferase RsmG [Paludibacteraceae bacterium]HQB68577.1 16S rRNA (guanine(527)-N(7))-methyltransferase RsmG [Paludibacteraceae bacterium]HRS67080.1 16S rRNA (guanine(527)-N(7))-methyltransferase RsmG [Paludibacteraceae bacterium]